MNEYQVDSLGIGKVGGNWTKVELVKADVMEAVTWYEGFNSHCKMDIMLACWRPEKNLKI